MARLMQSRGPLRWLLTSAALCGRLKSRMKGVSLSARSAGSTRLLRVNKGRAKKKEAAI